MNVERKGLAVIVGKNPAVVMGHLPLFMLYATGGQLVTDENRKIENALVPNCMKAFADTFGSPAIMALGAFDPWLCVTAFRQLCPFAGIIMK